MIARALRIVQAAREWRDAEQAKARAKSRFADAVAACVDDHASALAYEQTGELKTVWLIVRVRSDYPYEHEWIYADGSDASRDPRAIENQAAYAALREARKVAGIKRAVLSRMVAKLGDGK
jgi:hypothetical protein